MRSDRYLKENEEEIEKEQKEQRDKLHEEKMKKRTKKIGIILALFILLLLYSRVINPNTITVNEFKVENNALPESFEGLKIVHFSDIHYGTTIDKKKLNKIVTMINDLRPDIVVFTGDLFDKDIVLNEENYQDISDALSKIEPRLYKYAITGNEDTTSEKYYEIVDNSGFILLDNKAKLLFDGGLEPIALFGFSSSLEESQEYSLLESEEYKDYYKIVLVHEPDVIDSLSGADVVFAGHTMGGIIRIGIPLIKPEGATKYYKDKYIIEDTNLFISNGLGTNKFGIRFFNHPTINLYRMYKK